MPDTVINSITVVELDAGGGDTAYLTNAGYPVAYDSKAYVSAPALVPKPASITGDFSTEEYRLEKLPSTVGVLAKMALNVPFPKITLAVKELFLDDDGNVTDMRWRFRGLVYQAVPRIYQEEIDVIGKDYKYYLDRTAGVVCSEQCSAPYFGDSNICQKAVVTADYVVDSVSGDEITITTDPALSTPFIYNAGIIQFGGATLKIQYHETGRTFKMAKKVPAYWEGETVSISTGCDKHLETCRSIHNNESRFWGLGYSMVDYNPLYENP